MKLQRWVVVIVVVVAGAYCVHGLVTETGAAGWLNYAQQSLFGRYSEGFTAMLLMAGVGFVGIVAWSATERFGQTGDNVLTSPRGGRPPGSVWMWALALWLGMVAATWAIGYVAHAWTIEEWREDTSARYEAIVLADGAPAPRPTGTHVSLEGRLLGDRILTRYTRSKLARGITGSPTMNRSYQWSPAQNPPPDWRVDYHLVPVASPGWSPGLPVAFIVEVQKLVELPGQGLPVFRRLGDPEPPRDALLARLAGAVPVPAVQEFRKMGVPLAESHHLVRLVPSRGAQPALRDTRADNWTFTKYVCAGISVVITLFIGLVTSTMAPWRDEAPQVQANGGTAGVGGVSIEQIEARENSVPEFMKRRTTFEQERTAIYTLEDWKRFHAKWLDKTEWPRRGPVERREGMILGGRRWAPTFWAYDLPPEARYEYFFTLRTAGAAARGIRADDPKKAEDGWRQECPFCEISTKEIGDQTCPQCGRRLIFTLGRPPSKAGGGSAGAS